MPSWTGRVTAVDVQVGACRLTNLPLTLHFRSDWGLWWLPLEHVGGKPYTSVQLLLRIDPIHCRHLPFYNPGGS